MTLTELALQRTGFQSLAAFQRAKGLYPSGQADILTGEALLPYLLGYEIHLARPGDTVSSVARYFGSTAAAILAANPALVPEKLAAGQPLVVPLNYPVVPDGLPFTAALLPITIRGLRARYPFLQVESIAVTDAGRSIPALTMGSGGRRAAFLGAFHANEWITALVLMRFLETYAKAYAMDETLSGRRIRALAQNTTLYLIPMVNPDGVDLVTGAIAPGSAEYKRAQAIAQAHPQIPFPAGWKANLSGVDLNLNFPAGWQKAVELKKGLGVTAPAPQNFCGRTPLDQVESAAIANYISRTAPHLTLALHTQGREIYYDYNGLAPAGARSLGQKFAAASGYTLTHPETAASHAGFKDWFIQSFSRPGYTIEAGLGENPLPLEQLEQISGELLEVFFLALEQA